MAGTARAAFFFERMHVDLSKFSESARPAFRNAEMEVRKGVTKNRRQTLAMIFRIGDALIKAAESADESEYEVFVKYLANYATTRTLSRWVAITRTFGWCREQLLDKDAPTFSIGAMADLAEKKSQRPWSLALSLFEHGQPITRKIAAAIVEATEADPEFDISPVWTEGKPLRDVLPQPKQVSQKKTKTKPKEKTKADINPPVSPDEPTEDETDDTEEGTEATTDGETKIVLATIGATPADGEDDPDSVDALFEMFHRVCEKHGMADTVEKFTKLLSDQQKIAFQAMLLDDEPPKNGQATKATPTKATPEMEAEQLSRIEDEGVKATIVDWIAYKKERRHTYKEVGMKTLVTRVLHLQSEHGPNKLIQAVQRAIANRWQGFDQPGAWGMTPAEHKAEKDKFWEEFLAEEEEESAA